MAGAPDLFVVCKNCQSEVSPYITECPYCGQRLRKRAPKLDRDGRPREPVEPPPAPEPEVKKRKPPRLRRAERPQPAPRPPREPAPSRPRRPLATVSLAVIALVVTLGAQATLWPIDSLYLSGSVDGEWWRLLTTSFVYDSGAYQAVVLTTVVLFGWLLERRHGAWATVTVYLLGTLFGSALAVLLTPDDVSLGANAAALALLCAWAVRDVMGRRRGSEDDADMLGLAVWLAVLLLLPAVSGEANALAGLGGAVAGGLLGLPLARMAGR